MYKYLQEDTGQTQLKKVKCQRACKFCRKSHTTCEDTRPCQRCIKRDIAQLCLQDEADQLQQQAAQQAQQQMAAAAAGGSTNGTRSTVPAKRRGFSMSSNYEEDGRPPPPPPGAANEMNNGTNGGEFMQNNGASAGPGPNSTGTALRTPSPARQTGMMDSVPLTNVMTSPQDTFRALPTPMGAPGNRQWFDQQFQQMDGPAPHGVPPHQGAPNSGTTGATPEGFSWSALVEGMLETSPHTPGDFAWLSNGPTGATPIPMDGPTPNSLGIPQQQRGQQHGAPQPGSQQGSNNQPSSNEAAVSPTSVRDYRNDSSASPANSGIAADGTVQPFNYTFSYSRLRTYANDIGDPQFKARIAAATDRFKPILHGCLSQYSDDQIVQSEIQFLNYVRQWAVFCDTIPAPACVWRRTGEIYAANNRFMRLLDVSPDVIRKGRLTHYQILEPTSFLDYWEDYSSQVLMNLADRTSFDTNVMVAFAKRGDQRTHLLNSSMHFDSFGLPMAATVVFTPLFSQGANPQPNRANNVVAASTSPNATGPTNVTPASHEPTIDVQVGGDARNPIVRPIALSSLAQMWMW